MNYFVELLRYFAIAATLVLVFIAGIAYSKLYMPSEEVDSRQDKKFDAHFKEHKQHD